MSDANNNPRRSRLEDEVLEILAKSDRKPPLSAKARSWGRTARTRILAWQSQVRWLDSAWGWFALGLVIFVLGALLTGDSGLGRRIIEIAGLAAVLVGVLRLFRPSGGSSRKMWRGREINMRRPGVELGDKFDEGRKRR
jgi:hypothetical protein